MSRRFKLLIAASAFAFIGAINSAHAFVNEIQIHVAKGRLGQCGMNWDPSWRSPSTGSVFVNGQKVVDFDLRNQSHCERITRVSVNANENEKIDVLVVIHGPDFRMGAPLTPVAADRVWSVEFFNDMAFGGVLSTNWPQQGGGPQAGFGQGSSPVTILPDGGAGGQQAGARPQPGPTPVWPNPETGAGQQTGLPAPIVKLADNWNTAACNFTSEAYLVLQRDTRVDRLELWYSWRKGEGGVPFEIVASNGSIYSGNLMRSSCDPYQGQWCVATDAPRLDLPAGTYAIRASSPRLCQNAGSGGTGFIRAYGAPR